ncbi:MAG: EscU/YscU/HrcU family type III secretion system export apparatus switch protein [Fibrobacterota bacterium]
MKKQRPQAAALKYSSDDRAPRLVAKGEGPIAEEIMRRAAAAEVPVYEQSDLAGLLMELDLNSEIPPELYRAAAEVMSWVFQAEDRL